MKGKLIVGLVCLNVLLLAAVVTVNLQQSYGQVLGARGDYLMTVGHMPSQSPGQEMVYVTDLDKRYTVGFYVDQNTKNIVTVSGRDLVRDFGRNPQK